MYGIIFLLTLAFIWILVASVYDLRKRIVLNWLSFSLILFALGFRFFYSLFNENFALLYQGLIGLGIFFLLGNLLYYGRMFAGGDAKLMIALGAVLPLSENIITNLQIFGLFFILFLFAGAVYGLSWSFYFTLKKRNELKNEMKKQFIKFGKYTNTIMVLGLGFMAIGFYEILFLYLGIVIFLLPYLYVYSKSIDEVFLVKNVKSKNLEEGDWLYHNVRIGKKMIKADWNGLTKKEIREIRKKYKSVKIRQGIAFVPVFLISFLLLVYIWFFNQGLLELLPWS